MDLEDVVGLHLREERGLLLTPGTRAAKNTTTAYEYELVAPETGQAACVQVKSGNTRPDPALHEEFNGHVHLLSPAGYVETPVPENVTPLDCDEVLDYLNHAEHHLHFHIRVRLDFLREHLEL